MLFHSQEKYKLCWGPRIAGCKIKKAITPRATQSIERHCIAGWVCIQHATNMPRPDWPNFFHHTVSTIPYSTRLACNKWNAHSSKVWRETKTSEIRPEFSQWSYYISFQSLPKQLSSYVMTVKQLCHGWWPHQSPLYSDKKSTISDWCWNKPLGPSKKIIKPIGTEWCYTRLLVIPWQVRIPITLTPIFLIRPKTSEAVQTYLAECDSGEFQFLHFVLLFHPSGLRNSASNFFSNSSNTDSHLRERPNKKCALR